MKKFLWGLLLAVAMVQSVPALAVCTGSFYGDYEEYDFDDFSRVQNFCNGHARNFGIIQVGKDSLEPQRDIRYVEVDHWGQIDDFIAKGSISPYDAGFDDYCFYVQRRVGGGWGGNQYRYDARFYYQLGDIRGRGQWDVFNQFQEYAWYRVYQGWPFQVRLHFPGSCDDY